MDVQTGVKIPRLWWQGRRLRRGIPQLHVPVDRNQGVLPGAEPALSIVGVGESPVACYGLDSHSNGVTALLAHRIAQETGRAVSWHSVGFVGATVTELASRAMHFPEGPADVVFVAMGVNDTKNLVRRARWRHGWRELLSGLSDRYQAPIVVSEVPPMERFPVLPPWMAETLGRRARLLQAALDEELAQHGATSAPLFGVLSPDMFVEDGFHPGPLAHQAWADAVWPALSSVLIEGS